MRWLLGAASVLPGAVERTDWTTGTLYEACGDIPPAELEAAYCQNAALTEAGQTTT